MTPADLKLMAMDFVRMGGTLSEAWEATAATLLDRLTLCEQQRDRLREACGSVDCEIADMVHSRWAERQLQEGFKGMGHNILVEKCGVWKSPSQWSRLERCREKMSAIGASIDEYKAKEHAK